MSIVAIMCPRTGKQVSTGIEMSPMDFRSLPLTRHFVFHCWLCGHEHQWTKRWASLVDERDPALADAMPGTH